MIKRGDITAETPPTEPEMQTKQGSAATREVQVDREILANDVHKRLQQTAKDNLPATRRS